MHLYSLYLYLYLCLYSNRCVVQLGSRAGPGGAGLLFLHLYLCLYSCLHLYSLYLYLFLCLYFNRCVVQLGSRAGPGGAGLKRLLLPPSCRPVTAPLLACAALSPGEPVVVHHSVASPQPAAVEGCLLLKLSSCDLASQKPTISFWARRLSRGVG